MRTRLPFTLWTSIAGHMLRLVFISAAVLVFVIAFAATIKPLAEGKLDAPDALRFMLLAMAPMMAYALPFAAGFAATLVYHRMAIDHEAVAAHLGGLSHRSILMPAIMTAIVLMGVVALLSDQVIPRFLRGMQQMVTVDISRMFARQIARGNAVQQKGMLIYADEARSFGPEQSSGALDRLAFRNFAALELDAAGSPETEVSSASAEMWLFPAEEADRDGATKGGAAGGAQGQSRIVMRMEDVVAVRQGDWTAGGKDMTLRWNTPDPFRDKPSFLTYGEMRGLKAVPERMSGIDFPRRDLAYRLAERGGREGLEASAQRTGSFRLIDSRGRPVDVECGGFQWQDGGLRMLPPPGSSEIAATFSRGGPESLERTRVSSATAYLATDIGTDRYARRYDFRLEFLDARTRDATDGDDSLSAARAEIMLVSLTPVANPLPGLLEKGSFELLGLADERLTDEDVQRDATELRRKIVNLDNTVVARLNERLARTVACGLMVLTGAIAALTLTRRTPLTVYLWCFLPALFSLVTISGGEQVTKSTGPAGLFLLWGGVAIMAVYTLVLYLRLARH